MSNPSSPANASPVYLVVPAGGQGLRMGGGIPKQFRDWGGKPLILATLEAFFTPGMPRLEGVALAVPPDRIEEARAWSLPAPLWVVAGGATRQASVAAALAALPDHPEAKVLIHDAVRPFPPAQPIQAALDALDELDELGAWDGALLGEASTDTLKRVDAEGRVLGTEAREFIYRAQTPQVARLSTWRRAFDSTQAWEATDDVALLERLDLRVKLIPSPSSNLKLTTPEDWRRYSPRPVVNETTE